MPRKIRRAVGGENFFRIDAAHVFDQAGKIGVIGKRQRFIDAETIFGIRVNRPAGEIQGAFVGELVHLPRPAGRRGHNQNAIRRRLAATMGNNLAEVITELLVNFCQPQNGGMHAQRETVVAENFHGFLRFAERVGKDDGRFAVAKRGMRPVAESCNNFFTGRKLIAGMAEGAFHNEQIARGKLQGFRRGVFFQFEIAGIEQALAAALDENLRGAENMARRQKRHAIAVEFKRRVEIDCGGAHVTEASFHEFNRCRRGKNAAMGADVIGVRVGNAAGFAVAAAIKSENGIKQADGFVVSKQSWFMKSGVLNESLSLLRWQIFPGDKPAKNFFQNPAQLNLIQIQLGDVVILLLDGRFFVLDFGENF